jgi:DNA repair protein RadC
VTGAAAGIILMHNHPSGEPQPSDADIQVTRQMIQAGKVLGIEVVDHVIIGGSGHCSLSAMGYFYD